MSDEQKTTEERQLRYDSMKEQPVIPANGEPSRELSYPNSDMNKPSGDGIPKVKSGLQYNTLNEKPIQQPIVKQTLDELKLKNAEAERLKGQIPTDVKATGKLGYQSMGGDQAHLEAEKIKAETEARTKAEQEAKAKAEEVAKLAAEEKIKREVNEEINDEEAEQRLADQVKKNDNLEVDPGLEAEFATVGKVLAEKVNSNDVAGWADEFTKMLLKIDGVKPADLALVEAMKNQIMGLPEKALGPYKEWATDLTNWAFECLRAKNNKRKGE